MSAPQGEGYTVLIVDDHVELLNSLSFALKTLGSFHVETALDGIEGLTRICEMQPHCVVIDVKMPQIDGLQLVRAIRGDPATASIPIVVLSALVQEKDQSSGMLAGADVYLTKPTKPQDLVLAIHQTIQLSEADRQSRLQALAVDDDF